MIWIFHGEILPSSGSNTHNTATNQIGDNERFENMIEDPNFVMVETFEEVGGCDDDGVGDGMVTVVVMMMVVAAAVLVVEMNLMKEIFLDNLLRHTKANMLFDSAKDLAKFEIVKKAANEGVYEQNLR
jgi:hypothetical protein